MAPGWSAPSAVTARAYGSAAPRQGSSDPWGRVRRVALPRCECLTGKRSRPKRRFRHLPLRPMRIRHHSTRKKPASARSGRIPCLSDMERAKRVGAASGRHGRTGRYTRRAGDGRRRWTRSGGIRAEVVRSPDPAPRARHEGRRAPSRDVGRGARPDRRGAPRGTRSAARRADARAPVGIFSCSKATNEVNYAAQKLSRHGPGQQQHRQLQPHLTRTVCRRSGDRFRCWWWDQLISRG